MGFRGSATVLVVLRGVLCCCTLHASVFGGEWCAALTCATSSAESRLVRFYDTRSHSTMWRIQPAFARTQSLPLPSCLLSHVFHPALSFTGLQLLSRGDPDLILEQCVEFWDGQTLCPLTPADKKKMREIYRHWSFEDLHCIAFSYAPVPHKYYPLVFSDEAPVMLVEQRDVFPIGPLPLTASEQKMPIRNNTGTGTPPSSSAMGSRPMVRHIDFAYQ